MVRVRARPLARTADVYPWRTARKPLEKKTRRPLLENARLRQPTDPCEEARTRHRSRSEDPQESTMPVWWDRNRRLPGLLYLGAGGPDRETANAQGTASGWCLRAPQPLSSSTGFHQPLLAALGGPDVMEERMDHPRHQERKRPTADQSLRAQRGLPRGCPSSNPADALMAEICSMRTSDGAHSRRECSVWHPVVIHSSRRRVIVARHLGLQATETRSLWPRHMGSFEPLPCVR